jgi:hypothetical protein
MGADIRLAGSGLDMARQHQVAGAAKFRELVGPTGK